ncbi:MAG: RNA polymerase sigma factor [Saprospiraceae bacterium]
MEKNVTDLIQGCRKMDSHCQRKLFELFLPYVTSICKRYLRDKSLLKDVVQEVFLLIFKGLNHSFDEKKGDFKGWVRKIAINSSLKFNKRYQNFVELDTNIETEKYQIIANAIHNISKEEILQLINTIPITYRDVFNLHAIDGYSHAEIAIILEISIESSRKKLQRARAYLKKNIESGKNINLIKTG